MAAASAATPRDSVLLVSPSLQGHRLIYCRVLAGVLLHAGHPVIVAGDSADGAVAAHPLLADLRGRMGVRVVDSGPAADFSVTVLREMAASCRAGVVFCAEADSFIGDPGFPPAPPPGDESRMVALFVRSTNYQYAPLPPWWRRVRRRAPDRSAARSGARSFHEGVRLRRRPLAAALVLDERFAAAHPHTHRWMPDIYREFGTAPGGGTAETDRWSERLGGLHARAPRRPVVVYIGTNQERRGYDTLLRLAVEEEASFVHCGKLLEHDGPDARETERLRAVLRDREALLETAAPYMSPETAAVSLRAARCVVLPYRQHDGSSGVMLQALAAGRPVIVPDRGLMAYRTTTFGLGATYRSGDDADLRRVFRAALARRPEAHGPRLSAFMRSFTLQQLEAGVLSAVTGAGAGAALPQQVFGLSAHAVHGGDAA